MMKKYFLFLSVIAVLCCGCTSKEQDQKIKLFWLQQFAGVSMKALAHSDKLAALQPQQLGKNTKLSAAQSPDLANLKPATPLPAMLFVSPHCGRCQRLKKDGWAQKFKEQYSGKVALTEYDLSVPKNEELLHDMMRKHKMQRINYPAFFIGSSVAQGYPLDQKAQQITKKELAAFVRKNPAVPQKPLPQIIEVTMESDEIKGVAPQADLARMKRALSAVQLANQKTLTDIGTTFGETVKNKALMITTATERKLKQEASVSATFTDYLTKQRELLTEQNKQLNQLMTQNAKNIRNINTRSNSL
ncbi:MAG: hypothetical protein E7027_01640 [Elusimicrobium sp.]|uniref:Thioredoxin domain-containing protein n=1 Tax=Candidatus Avelusimicrobium gallicola TaxID=2562704 RepID=A0A928HFP2_9BACT|nr:hypothetical protein [Elusimicrobium sp.]